MREICGDISEENKLSKKEKFAYLAKNFWRGISTWSFPGKVKGSTRTIHSSGTDSPGRIYVDTYLREVLPTLVFPGKIRVLDIGCGTGYVQTLLAELGYTGEYVGLDVVREPGFSTHTDAFEVSFVESKIEDYASEAPFDLVLSNTTFEHIEDDRAGARAAGRLLAEGGAGVHIVPSFWSLFLYLFHGYRQYTPRMLRRAFKGQEYAITGLGGLGSFLLHFLGITLPERVFGAKGIRSSSWYPRAVDVCGKIDRALPICRALYSVVVRPKKDTRSRVLFALPSLLVGGIEQQLMLQLARYDRARFSLALVTLFEYKGREDVKSRLPEDVEFESIGMNGAFDWGGWGRLIEFLKRWKPDVVVSSMFSANTALRLLKPFFKYSAIAREHNIYDEKKWWQRVVDRVLSSWTCCIIAVSKSVATFASRQAGIAKDKFTVIQNGVDLRKLQEWHAHHSDKEALKESLGFSRNDRIVLTVGRLKAAKNHAALIEAFRGLEDAYSNYKLVIIGAGVEREALQEFVKSIPDGRVHLLERYGDAVWPYYAAADWFILPSYREGFPNVMLEAMAFGLPLMGTDISGTNECIEEGVNGFFISTSASGIRGSLRRAFKLSLGEVDGMGRASREKVKQFSIEETVRKYEESFTTCRRAN